MRLRNIILTREADNTWVQDMLRGAGPREGST
jgi:hypothetical protein